MHRQIKISHGVYVTDFRPNCQLKGIDTSTIKAQTKDVGLLLDKVHNNQSKIKQLSFTIQAIQQQQGWEKDRDFLQAIEEDYEKMIKFSEQMKEWIVELASLKYKPENDKIQELIDAHRIENRENEIEAKFNTFLKQFGSLLLKADAKNEETNKQLVEIDYGDGGLRNVNKNQSNQPQENKEQQGIYL